MREASTKRWVLVLTSLASFIVVLDSQVLTVALTSIRTDLHASIEALQWTMGAYTLSMAVLLMAGGPPGGPLGRRGPVGLGVAPSLPAAGGGAGAQGRRSPVRAPSGAGGGGAAGRP